jgi:hypothetical protein
LHRIPLALFVAPLFVSLAACPGGGDDTETGEDTSVDTDTGPKTFEDFINVTVAPMGDFGGWAPGSDWIVQEVDSAKQVELPGTGIIEDFETGDTVSAAKLEIWHDTNVTRAADGNTTSDQNGAVSVTLKACADTAYLVSTPPELDETKPTWEMHQIYEPNAGLTAIEAPAYNSVSSVTYRIIPSILGVSPQSDKSIIAGTVYDANNEPVEAAQVVAKDASGNVLDIVVKYFVDDFPNREQPHTSADGLWIAINVPPGATTIEAWGFVDSEHKLLGATQLTTFADSINISNIYTGFGTGLKYPPNCLVLPD